MEFVNTSWQENLCILSIGTTEDEWNKLSLKRITELAHAVAKALQEPQIEGLILTAPATHAFCVGLDLSELENLISEKEAEHVAQQVRQITNKLANAKIPTVTAVHRACLGAGFDLALACHYFICSTDPRTSLGFPEIRFGLLPAGGGIQRLVRRTGLSHALELLLSGKTANAETALKANLLDSIAPQERLLAKAIEICKEARKVKYDRNLPFRLEIDFKLPNINTTLLTLERTPIGRKFLEHKFEEWEHHSLFPSECKSIAHRVFHLSLEGTKLSAKKNAQAEIKAFGEMAVSAQTKSLIHLFYCVQRSRKNLRTSHFSGKDDNNLLRQTQEGSTAVGVVGVGKSGSALAMDLAGNGFRTILVDRTPQKIRRGLGALVTTLDLAMRAKKILPWEKEAALARVVPAVDFAGLANTAFVVETQESGVEQKREALRLTEEAHGQRPFLYATDLWGLALSQVASMSDHPETILATHFAPHLGSCHGQRNLVEMATTEKTSPDTTLAFAKLMEQVGRLSIFVKDSPGMYTTRVLAFWVCEALHLLAEGASIDAIDNAAEAFGFRAGPFKLIDHVGVDLCLRAYNELKSSYSARLSIPEKMEEALAQRQPKRGLRFYTRADSPKPNTGIYQFFEVHLANVSEETIQRRLVHVFLNEAAHCLDERVIQSTFDGDLGATLGMGFPAFRGGPFHYINTVGKCRIKEILVSLNRTEGDRFAPAKYWSESGDLS